MCSYLDYIDASDNFSLISKSEDLFLKLQAVLKSYPDNYITDWNPDDEDINQLKIVAFNHIRANYEGKDFRNLIGGPRDMSGIFAHKEIWQKFLKKHSPLVENVEKELNAMEKKGKLKDLKQREEFFIEKTKPTLENNMTLGKEALNNKKRSGEITDLITEALDKLNAVNMNKFVSDFKQEAYKALENLIYKAEQMKATIIKDVYKKAK
jgi:Fe-S cluster biosynthesis and repair protein YggX